MKITLEELKKLDPQKLAEELKKFKKELFKIRFEVQSDQSKNTHLIRRYRKTIARIETERTRRECDKVAPLQKTARTSPPKS